MENTTKRDIFNLKLNNLLGTLSNDNILEQNRTKQKSKTVNGSVYDNRYHAQKEIIKAQKVTIFEQKQKIEKLILQNTTLENEVAFLKEIIENMKHTTINKAIDSKSSNDVKTLSQKDPNILLKMKQRDEERKKRWQYIKEQKANRERIKKVLQAEKEEEERLRLIEEKKRREQDEIAKKIAIEEELKRIKAKKQIAIVRLKNWQENYYVFVGFWKWILFIKIVRNKRDIVAIKLNRILVLKYLERWWFNSSAARKKRLFLAEKYRKKKIQKHVVNKWKNFVVHKKNMRICIQNVFNQIYINKIIIAWNCKIKKTISIREEKFKIFTTRFNRFIQRFYFIYWKELPKRLQEKREQEHRLRTWHSRVKEILPDFDIDDESPY